MKQPKGFEKQGREQLFCKLKDLHTNLTKPLGNGILSYMIQSRSWDFNKTNLMNVYI